jgi:hypothetical protein
MRYRRLSRTRRDRTHATCPRQEYGIHARRVSPVALPHTPGRVATHANLALEDTIKKLKAQDDAAEGYYAEVEAAKRWPLKMGRLRGVRRVQGSRHQSSAIQTCGDRFAICCAGQPRQHGGSRPLDGRRRCQHAMHNHTIACGYLVRRTPILADEPDDCVHRGQRSGGMNPLILTGSRVPRAEQRVWDRQQAF